MLEQKPKRGNDHGYRLVTLRCRSPRSARSPRSWSAASTAPSSAPVCHAARKAPDPLPVASLASYVACCLSGPGLPLCMQCMQACSLGTAVRCACRTACCFSRSLCSGVSLMAGLLSQHCRVRKGHVACKYSIKAMHDSAELSCEGKQLCCQRGGHLPLRRDLLRPWFALSCTHSHVKPVHEDLHPIAPAFVSCATAPPRFDVGVR